jgi:hypothetical protein
MTDMLMRLTHDLRSQDGFLIGRVALVVLLLAIIVVAALIALVVPN